ncbi:protein EMSY-LIKE 3-like isoform X2 [Asparagus officinalis]|uniref:protein EMSY-LIKE 3-like isoform X2 n=1 Tax=Asparagus officinalis TaxID=4686 RepID=UPI00098E38EC|nr:protein EMSY-LIKE 3-like isoform X2 [Asparagus officinalis]
MSWKFEMWWIGACPNARFSWQISRGILFSGALRIISKPIHHRKDSDMDFQIHCIETEAYGAVLRAFIAQSEVLTWDKEELITELRKELRVSDAEHREILAKVNQDESIKSIRERHKVTDGQRLSVMNPSASDSMFVGHLSRKRLKPAQTHVTSSPKYAPSVQPSPMHVRDGHRNSNTSVLSPQMRSGQPVIPALQNRQAPSSGKLRGSLIVQASNTGVHSDLGNIDSIEIRKTNKVINEVEKLCEGLNPDPGQIERAKMVLRDHERALMDAIGRLTHMSDGKSSINIQMKNGIGAGSPTVMAAL